MKKIRLKTANFYATVLTTTTRAIGQTAKVTFIIIAMLTATLAVKAAPPPMPMPSMAVPRLDKAPVIDGIMSEGEWDRAAACTGFVPAFENLLAHVQTVVWFGYDDTYLYVCFKNYRTEKNVLLSKRARGNDDVNIVFDHANEIWFSPPGSPAATYQAMFNAYPAICDVMKIPSVGYTQMSWSGQWEMKSTETRDYWIVEGRTPIATYGKQPVRDGTVWRGLFCNDDLAGTGGGFTAWAPGLGFELIDRHGFFHFFDHRPSLQLLDVETLFTGKARIPVAVSAPTGSVAKVTVTLRIGAGLEAAKEDLVLSQVLDVPAGSRQQHVFEADLTMLKLPVRPGTKDKDGKTIPGCPAGVFDLKAVDADGTVLYSQAFPFCVDGFVRKPPDALKTSRYDTPLGVETIHAPLSHKLIVKLDRLYMPDRERAVAGTIRLLDPATGKAVISAPACPFINDYSETILDVSQLKLPVETPENWQTLGKDGGIKPAVYPIEVVLTDAGGKELAKVKAEASLLDHRYEWLGHQIGISDKVIPPWTPMTHSKDRLSMWNKTYKLNALGLSEEIVNDGRPQLSGPMELVAVVDGHEAPIKASPHELVKLTDAGADLKAVTQFGDLDINVTTRVEFDGFVLNTMKLEPRKPVTLDRLSLLVRMPAKESECFCATAGGWMTTAGFTPDVWSAKDSCSGSRYGSFVPYVFLTDSDRGFCWFADNDKDWVIDPNVPEQDMRIDGGIRTLRVHFIGRKVTLTEPLTIIYGWMVTPQKPQPEAWRAYQINDGNSSQTCPQTRSVTWADFDRIPDFDYYSRPYPRDYSKSRELVKAALANRGVVPCVGQAGESIGLWHDYTGRDIDVLKADWAVRVGNRYLGIVTQARGPTDYRIWHYDKWMKDCGLPGIYFDLNYLSEEWNYLTGTAYFLPDHRIQPGYSYIGFREFNKRLRYTFYANGFKPPNIWMHTTLGHPVYSWMPDVAMEGENVLPSSREYDYQDAAPAGRLRAIVNGRQLGAVPTMMTQADRFPDNPNHPFLMRQIVGWLLAHDCLPQYVEFWSVMASEMEMWRDDIKFIGYWQKDQRLRSDTEGIIVSAHVRPGHAVLWINNTLRKDLVAKVQVDLAGLGLNPAKTVAFDAETGEAVAVKDGRFSIPVESRLWRAVRLQTLNRLAPGETFAASFDNREAAADEALGNRYALGSAIVPAEAQGRSGAGLGLDKAVSFSARQHLSAASGTLAFAVSEKLSSTNGMLCRVGPLQLRAANGQLVAQWQTNKEVVAKEIGKAVIPGNGAWRNVAISWKGTRLRVELDGGVLIEADLPGPLPIPAAARGLDIAYRERKAAIPTVIFGPLPGVAIDDLRMRR